MTDPVKAKIIELVPEIEDFDENDALVQRKITLADVLRAIPQRHTIEFSLTDPGILELGCDIYPSENSYVKWCKWNLTADYDNQTQEVKDFIGRLIGVV